MTQIELELLQNAATGIHNELEGVIKDAIIKNSHFVHYSDEIDISRLQITENIYHEKIIRWSKELDPKHGDWVDIIKIYPMKIERKGSFCKVIQKYEILNKED